MALNPRPKMLIRRSELAQMPQNMPDFLTRDKMTVESGKILDDPVYWMDNYVYILDSQKMAKVKWTSWPCQLELLKTIHQNKQTIVVKARQLGISWAVVGYILWTALYSYGARISIFSQGEEEAKKLLERIRFIYKNLPTWLRCSTGISNTQTMSFPSRESSIFAYPATEYAGQGESATLVFADEWAYHPFPEKQYVSIKPTIDAAGGKFIAVTTGNGAGTFVHKVWQDAVRKDNNFVPLFFNWKDRPDRTDEWFEEISKDYSKKELKQAYPMTAEEAFIQGGSPVFDDEYLVLRAQNTKPLNLQTLHPDYKIDAKFKVYQVGRLDRKYCIGVDVAEGETSSETADYSVVTVIDWDANEEVAFLRGRWDTHHFALLVNQIANLYPGIVAVERNGIGLAVIKKLEELGCPGLFREQKQLLKSGEMPTLGRHGWVTSSMTKPVMITDLEEALRLGYHRVASEEFLEEARVFQDLGGGKYAAPRGFHDDCCLSRAIALQMRKYMSQATYNGPRVIKSHQRLH